MSNQPARIINALEEGNLSINDFNETNNDFVNSIYLGLSPENLIAVGGVGKVYIVGDYVVKEATPCQSNLPQLLPYCTDVQDLVFGKPITIIPSGDKFRYILPNLLSEATIGMLFKESQISINFSEILASFILVEDDKPSVYFIMPLYRPIYTGSLLDSSLSDPLSYLYLLFQVSSALMASQEKFLFTHYDLHIDNILLDDWPKGVEYLSYPLSNSSRIQIPKDKCPFIAKISDYGLSRLETERALITPSVSDKPDAGYGEFNPSYDIISFIGSSLFDDRTSLKFNSLKSNPTFYFILMKLVLWIFKDTQIKIPSLNLNDLLKVKDEIGKKYYKQIGKGKIYFRPLPHEQNAVRFANIRSMPEIVDYLAGILLKLKMADLNVDRSRVLALPSLAATYRKYDSIIPYDKNIPLPKIPKPGEMTFKSVEMDIEPNFINLKTYRLLLADPPNNFNFTIDPKQIEYCPYQEHYLTVIRVKKNTPNYVFTSECCMLDPINYLRLNDFAGFVINGGFFARYTDYLPIGKYKDPVGKFDNNPIPEEYRDVYGFLALTDNQMTITRNPDLKSDYLFSSGPVLIENGEIVFDPNQERFACVSEDTTLEVIGKTEDTISVSGYFDYSLKGNQCRGDYVEDPRTYPRCDKIKPGELSHADNPNPRTAACILENGDYLFLTVEGRGERGIGLDLPSLSSIIKRMYPNVKSAINLDGGRSTNMAWRVPKNPNKVYISNPKHMYQYPVGNLLTFKKKNQN